MSSAKLVYSILCDDVRIEMGNKLSLMGIFESLFLNAVPTALLKFAVVNHWVGVGEFEAQVKVLSPDGRELAVAAPSKFHIESQGYADNITFFTNVAFDRAGTFTIRTYLDGKLITDRPMYVRMVQAPPSSVN